MQKQSGNILFFILIAIFLLGGLTVLMSRTSSQSEDTGSGEQASIAASQILKQASSVHTAVQTLLSRGCSENELDFYDASANLSHTDFRNSNRAANEKCNVYHVNGTGLKQWKLPQSYFLSSTSYSSIADWLVDVNASYNVTGTPTTTSDLVFNVYSMRKDICVAINRILNISLEASGDTSIEDYGTWWEYYQGRFRTDTNGIGNILTAKHSGKKSGCVKDAGDSAYNFYYVLIAK